MSRRLHRSFSYVNNCDPSPKYPFSDDKHLSKLGIDIYMELRKSWEAHCKASARKGSLNAESASLLSVYSDLLKEVTDKEKDLRNHIMSCLRGYLDETENTAVQVIASNILRVANIIPTCSKSDLAYIALHGPSMIDQFNSHLSETAKANLYRSILVWLELCVLQDKVYRLCEAALEVEAQASTIDLQAIVKRLVVELENHREWDVAKYPYWLVLEVEQGIQIRRNQYVVAQHLITNPGHIMQLNMGLGKTRVILPMLILHGTFLNKDNVCRIHILSPLFDEAYEFLHRTLCASVLNKRIFTLPFSRDVKLTFEHVCRMQSAIEECIVEGGFMIVKPEHRLSLEMKLKESVLYKSSDDKRVHDGLEQIIYRTRWYNILDESDEILHVRYQLIYALGDIVQLPDGHIRWSTAQALTDLLCRKEMKEFLLEYPNCVQVEYYNDMERFPLIRFIDGDVVEPFQNDVGRLLIDMLFSDDAPEQLRWLAKQKEGNALKIKTVVSDITTDPNICEHLPEALFLQVLSLRGYIAHGILINCLLQRNRVDFGVSRKRVKRLAVPFRSADTPSERSELAHPEVAIIKTILSYYYDGLNKYELKEAFETLLRSGESAQKRLYGEWISLVKSRIPVDSLDKLDIVSKIDLTNDHQFDLLVCLH